MASICCLVTTGNFNCRQTGRNSYRDTIVTSHSSAEANLGEILQEPIANARQS